MFGDVYFSRSGGLREAEAVFLAGAGLPEGWRDRRRFAVCELGFGAGVNVLAAWRAWKQTQSAHAQLHISTIEAYPMDRADAARCLAAFPEVADFAGKLLEHWPVRAFGPQVVRLDANVSLTVWVGEAEPVLSGLSGAFDAWFLDGFSPQRNLAMWSEGVFDQVARLSAPGARVATYTVAGAVRRGLEGAGFAVEKKPGFGAKRERLEARLQRPSRAVASGRPFPYARVAKAERVAVVGAGIAGSACAHALTARGVEVVVVDSGVALGAGASGNPAGLVMPRLDRGGALSEVFLAAYVHAVAAYEAMGGAVFQRIGVEQRPRDADRAALADIVADPPLPPDWMCAFGEGALHRRAGLLRPLRAIERMLEGATLMTETAVEAIDASGAGWVVSGRGGRAIVKADAVVLACGAALASFAPARFLPLELSRGQIEWGAGAAPARALVSGSYLAPFEGGVLFGATFDKKENVAGVEADEASRGRNLAAVAALAPDVAATVAGLNSRASLRAATPDYAPIAGLLPDAAGWLAAYAPLAHGRRVDARVEPPAQDGGLGGVYVLGGLGARGLTLAPLLGERIAREICGEPQALSRAGLDAIHPARFLLRALKRGG